MTYPPVLIVRQAPNEDDRHSFGRLTCEQRCTGGEFVRDQVDSSELRIPEEVGGAEVSIDWIDSGTADRFVDAPSPNADLGVRDHDGDVGSRPVPDLLAYSSCTRVRIVRKQGGVPGGRVREVYAGIRTEPSLPVRHEHRRQGPEGFGCRFGTRRVLRESIGSDVGDRDSAEKGRLSQHEFDFARIDSRRVGDSVGPWRDGHLIEVGDPSLGERDDLRRDDEDVAVLHRRRFGGRLENQSDEVLSASHQADVDTVVRDFTHGLTHHGWIGIVRTSIRKRLSLKPLRRRSWEQHLGTEYPLGTYESRR